MAKRNKSKKNLKIEPKTETIKVKITPITKQPKTTTLELVRKTTVQRLIAKMGYRVSEETCKLLALMYTEKVRLEIKALCEKAYKFTTNSNRKTIKKRDITVALKI